MLGDLMASVQPIEIKIFGSDQKNPEWTGKKVSGEIEKIEGVEDVFDGVVIAGPSIEVVSWSAETCHSSNLTCFIPVSASDNGWGKHNR